MLLGRLPWPPWSRAKPSPPPRSVARCTWSCPPLASSADGHRRSHNPSRRCFQWILQPGLSCLPFVLPPLLPLTGVRCVAQVVGKRVPLCKLEVFLALGLCAFGTHFFQQTPSRHVAWWSCSLHRVSSLSTRSSYWVCTSRCEALCLQ
jgi:hypothetical protein